MNALRLNAAAMSAFVVRDARVFVSYRLRLPAQLLAVLFSLTLFYYVSRLVSVPPFDGPDAYFAYVVVGLVILQVLQTSLAAGARLQQELVAGTFERLVATAFGPVRAIAAMMAFPFFYAWLLSACTLALAAVVFGMPVSWSTAALALPVSLLGALAFAPIGLLLVALVIVVKQAAAGAGVVLALISIVSGLYFPVTLLPGWIAWAADVQPFTPAVDLLRHLIVDTPLQGSGWGAVAKLAAFAAVLTPLALVALSTAVAAARRRGTLTEY